jgi:hypothetical protein
MEAEKYIRKLETAKESVLNGEANDLERLEERRGAMNQRFTVFMFAMNEVGSTKGDTKFVRDLLETDEYELELGTVKGISIDIFADQVEMYDVRYHLEDTAVLLNELVDVIEEIEDEDTFYETMKHVQEYMNYLGYQIGVRIPFHDLGVAFEGRSTVDEVYYQ